MKEREIDQVLAEASLWLMPFYIFAWLAGLIGDRLKQLWRLKE